MNTKQISVEIETKSSIAEVLSLQDLRPGVRRWSLCNDNRNKVHNKCNTLEPLQNHPHPSTTPSVEKLTSTKSVSGAKKFGEPCSIVLAVSRM